MTHIVRPARLDDLKHLYEMAKLTGGGFTNLPPDRDALSAKLERSAAAFARACSGERAPGMTVETPSWAATHASATCAVVASGTRRRAAEANSAAARTPVS